jgi:phosphoribosylaminoimidazole carboxylase PurK protein
MGGMNGGTIGIVGGGQLGRMLTLAAKPLGFDVVVLNPTPNSPAAQVGAKEIVADLYDTDALAQLAERVDFLTIEIEHLDAGTLEKLEKLGKPVNPSPATIKIIQDKLLQKHLLKLAGIPTADFTEVNGHDDAVAALKAFGGKMLLKSRHGAYDGRGNRLIAKPSELAEAFEYFGDSPLYAEAYVPFVKELAVDLARSTTGEIVLYPLVETVHKNNICVEVLAPAPVNGREAKNALKIAEQTAKLLKGAGVFAIEMFLTKGGKVLVNEIAPRVHNSGHYTIEATPTSQFEQHIRAISGLPLGKTDLTVPAAVMVNILGERDGPLELMGVEDVLALSDTHLHLYGKSPTKKARKMGHITVTANSLHKARKKAKKARSKLNI